MGKWDRHIFVHYFKKVIPMIQFSELVESVQRLLHDVMFMIRYREKETYFTRSSQKLTFPKLMCFVLSLPKASMQAEVNRFLNQFAPEESMAKSSVQEARLKISPYAFSAINDFIVDKCYQDGLYKTFKGYRLIAVDGSIFDVNAGAASGFGEQETAGNPVVKAQVVALADVLNDIVIDALMGSYTENEREMALEAIDGIRGKAKPHDLYIFDRGFPSAELIGDLAERNARFLMRVSRNFLKAVNQANAEDQIVQIKDAKGKARSVRVVNVLLPNGDTEKLITNAHDLTPDELRELYNLRWGIETKFLLLKERLQIENFTSSRTELVLQDFYATIVIANLVTTAKYEATLLNENLSPAKARKYEYKVNTNIAVATLRDTLIFALLEQDPRKARRTVDKALRAIRKSLIPIRGDRQSAPRTRKNLSQKFPLNKKSGW